MTGMKIVAASSIGGIVVAQATPIDPWSQLVSTCVCGAILAWVVVKTIPAIIRDHRDGLKDVASAIKENTEEMRKRDQKLLELMDKHMGDPSDSQQ